MRGRRTGGVAALALALALAVAAPAFAGPDLGGSGSTGGSGTTPPASGGSPSGNNGGSQPPPPPPPAVGAVVTVVVLSPPPSGACPTRDGEAAGSLLITTSSHSDANGAVNYAGTQCVYPVYQDSTVTCQETIGADVVGPDGNPVKPSVAFAFPNRQTAFVTGGRSSYSACLGSTTANFSRDLAPTGWGRYELTATGSVSDCVVRKYSTGETRMLGCGGAYPANVRAFRATTYCGSPGYTSGWRYDLSFTANDCRGPGQTWECKVGPPRLDGSLIAPGSSRFRDGRLHQLVWPQPRLRGARATDVRGGLEEETDSNPKQLDPDHGTWSSTPNLTPWPARSFGMRWFAPSDFDSTWAVHPWWAFTATVTTTGTTITGFTPAGITTASSTVSVSAPGSCDGPTARLALKGARNTN